jgi:hypothetical protein
MGQGEDVFVPIVPDQGRLDHLNGGMAADVTKRGQHFGVAFAGDDGADDPHAGRTGDAGPGLSGSLAPPKARCGGI